MPKDRKSDGKFRKKLMTKACMTQICAIKSSSICRTLFQTNMNTNLIRVMKRVIIVPNIM